MADVTGVFKADFSSFFDAVEQSQIKLKGLEADSSKVESNLSRMANAFSGQKIIQEASLMAEVFERAGGAAAFTQKELERMGAVGSEAVEKLKALGKDIPDGIQKIADQTKTAAKETEGWGLSIKNLVGGFLTIQTLMAGWNFVKDIVASAGALEDLSAQTRINVEDLQIMGEAMGDFGVSTDELGRALFKLSNNIARGDNSTVQALKDLGLSLAEVQNLHGEELFRTIQEAAGKLNNSLSDTALVTLYGEKLAKSMAGAAAATGDALDAARDHAAFMRAEDVAAMDAASEATEKLILKLKAKAAALIGPVSRGLLDYMAVQDKAGALDTQWARTQDKAIELLGGQAHKFEDLAASVGVETSAKRMEREATEAGTSAGNLHVGMLTAQTDEYKKQVDHMKELVRLKNEKKDKEAAEAAAGLADFQRQTNEAQEMTDINERARKQKDADAEHQRTNQANAINDQTALNTATEGGAHFLTAAEHAAGGYSQSLEEVNRVNQAAIDFEKQRGEEQKQLDEENKKLIESTTNLGTAHTAAGDKAAEGTKQTVDGYAAVQQQIVFTGEAIKEWTNLMRYSAQAQAILGEGHLFTTQSQRDRIAGLPSFASGVENFQGGLAKVHGGEVLANLPPGTSVFPRGQGLGATINNTFNLVDSESNLARRVADLIMRNVRAGTQLGTA